MFCLADANEDKDENEAIHDASQGQQGHPSLFEFQEILTLYQSNTPPNALDVPLNHCQQPSIYVDPI